MKEIHSVVFYCRDANDVFPDYPSVEEGGSQWLFKTKPPELLAQEEEERVSHRSYPYLLFEESRSIQPLISNYKYFCLDCWKPFWRVTYT